MAYTTIKKPSEHMTASLWTGNGTKITTGFSPDFIWFKARNAVSYAGILNAITGYDKYLQSFSTDAETTSAGMMVTDSTGYTPGSVLSSNSYVGWSWKANGAGSANTAGSISSTVSASATSGFSIVSWTGTGANATIGHGLSSVPKMILTKSRSAIGNWYVYHATQGATKFFQLQAGDAVATNSTIWNNTEPTSSVFSTGTAFDNGTDYIAYCFADVQGYSKFGSYVGNGNVDGTFVYTGFKPAFVIYKNANAVLHWGMYDNKRSPSNVVDDLLFPNLSNAEAAGSARSLDLLSNGFKIRATADIPDINGSGNTIIYMAFAEQPLVGDNPATAR